MLEGPLPLTTAKLDINLLLKSSPSPTPVPLSPLSSSGLLSESLPAVAGRSTSVPPYTAHSLAAVSSHRTSLSGTSAVTLQAPLSSTVAPSPQRLHQKISPKQIVEPNSYPSAAPSAQFRPILPPINPNASLSTPPPQSQRHQPRSSQAPPYQSPLLPSPINPPSKRPPPTSPHPAANPAKRQSKWTAEEDALIIDLRGSGMKWEDISKRLPGRSAISCRLHYQNYLERRSEWDEERKNRLARLYERLKPEMWGRLAAELGIPWRAAEAMHWQLGEADMARRAGVVPFSLVPNNAISSPNAAGHLSAQSPPTQVLSTGHQASSVGTFSGPVNASGIASVFNRTATDSARTYYPALGPECNRDLESASPFVASLSASAESTSTHGILPSMAELERGIPALDGPLPTTESERKISG